MIVFLIFIAFWLGLSLTSAYIALSIVAIVFLIFTFKRFSKSHFVFCASFLLLGFIASFVQPSYNKSSYQGLVYDAKENYFLLNSGGERLYVYAKNHSYDIGDILTIEGKKEDLSFDSLESAFNFKSYLNKRGVYKSLKVKRVKVNYRNFIRIKERRKKLLAQFSKEQQSIVGAIMFSDGGDSEISDTLRELHLARYLGASGIFVGFFHLILKFLFTLLLKDKFGELASIGVLSLYAVFTFPRFSVIKVILLLLLRWINKYPLKNKFSYLGIIGGFGLSCLMINRYLAYQDGFVLGLLIPIISYLSRNIASQKKIKHFLYRYLIIYLFFLPFEINYYNKIVIFSLPLQIVSTPLFMAVAIVSLLCFFYVPIYGVDKFFITGIKGYASFISPLSIGVHMGEMNQVTILLYYILYFFFLYYASHDFVPLKRFFLLGQIAFISVLALPIKNLISDEVNFIYVGQGDCTLIRHKNQVALIDTGGLTYTDVANNSLVPFLRKKKIYRIDLLMITHYDYDHYGALEELHKKYPIKSIVDYHSSFPVKMGDVTFTNYNYFGFDSIEENDKSLVISFSLCHHVFLVMGDAPSNIEKEIIKNYSSIPCDILKVGHHGSNTSTSEAWIKYINPKEAIVSCGKNNRFGHPNKEVINVLNKYKIKIRRTDLEGTIKYSTMFN